MAKTVPISSGDVIYYLSDQPEKGVSDYENKLASSPYHRLVLISSEPFECDHPQVVTASKEKEEELKEAVWKTALLKTKVVLDGEMWKTLEEHILELKRGVDSIAALFADTQFPTLKNLFENLSLSTNALPIEAFKEHLKGVPAVVIGAGPSLAKAIPRIKSVQEHAALFAGGAALVSLEKEGIKPDFIANLDPHSSKKRLEVLKQFNAPTFYQTCVNPLALRNRAGPKIFVGESPDLFFEKWVYEKLGITSDQFDSGYTSVTFQIAIARYLGCSPIALAGVDLCGQSEKIYDKKVEKTGDGWVKFRGKNGERMETRDDWLLSKSWIEKQAEQKEIQRIEPSQIEIKNTTPFSIKKDVLDKRLKIEDVSPIDLTEEKLQTFAKELGEEIEKGTECITQLMHILEKNYPNSPLKKEEWYATMLRFEKSVIYNQFVKPIWSVWVHIYRREPEINQSPLHFEINKVLFFQTLLENLNHLRKNHLQS